MTSTSSSPQLFADADLIRCPGCQLTLTIADWVNLRWQALTQATSPFHGMGRRPGLGWSDPVEILCPTCIMTARWTGSSWLSAAYHTVDTMMFKRRYEPEVHP